MANTSFEKASEKDSWQDKVLKIKLNMALARKLESEVAGNNQLEESLEPSLFLACPKDNSSSLEENTEQELDLELENTYLAICRLNLRDLSVDEITKQLDGIISPTNIRYSFLIAKVRLRLYKELMGYTKLYLKAQTREEALEVKEIMEEIKLKISSLGETLTQEELISETNESVNLFFLTSSNGNVIFYDSLIKKKVTVDYYPQVLGLLQLMKQGIFKQVKKLLLHGMSYYQARNDFIRITFDKLSNGNYIIIDVFVKMNPTKKYRDMLSNRAKQYLELRPLYLASLNDEDFIKEHNRYYQDIIAELEDKRVVGSEKTTSDGEITSIDVENTGGERVRCQKN